MVTFWITFRIYEARVGSKSYEDRYKAFVEVIKNAATSSWAEPTSFIAFSSKKNIDAIATACKGAIAPSHDLFLIREMDTKSARIYGKYDDSVIFTLMPYLKNI